MKLKIKISVIETFDTGLSDDFLELFTKNLSKKVDELYNEIFFDTIKQYMEVSNEKKNKNK